MIKVGSILRLHESVKYRVEEFFLEVGEYSGSWETIVKLTEIESGETFNQALWMVEDLIRDSQLYPIENEEFMKKYWEARRKRESCDLFSQ